MQFFSLKICCYNYAALFWGAPHRRVVLLKMFLVWFWMLNYNRLWGRRCSWHGCTSVRQLSSWGMQPAVRRHPPRGSHTLVSMCAHPTGFGIASFFFLILYWCFRIISRVALHWRLSPACVQVRRWCYWVLSWSGSRPRGCCRHVERHWLSK